jgi:hypothetical protein
MVRTAWARRGECQELVVLGNPTVSDINLPIDISIAAADRSERCCIAWCSGTSRLCWRAPASMIPKAYQSLPDQHADAGADKGTERFQVDELVLGQCVAPKQGQVG